MVSNTEISIFEVPRSNNIVCCMLDISSRACLSALVV